MLKKEPKVDLAMREQMEAEEASLPRIGARAAVALNAEIDRAVLTALWNELGTGKEGSGRYRFMLDNLIVPNDKGKYDPRELNQPYPSEALSQRGYAHTGRVEVYTPFKYLLYNPIFVNEERSLLLLPTQIEGGVDGFSGEEVCCEDCLILLKLDTADGRFKQIDTWRKGDEAPARYFSRSFERLEGGEIRMEFFVGYACLDERRFRVEDERILNLK